jgi:galactose-1-phosphate uridylyltransferase
MTIAKDLKIMELLGINEIRHLIAHTNKGELTLMLRKGENRYRFVLDAVPVSEIFNKELMDLLYPEPKAVIPQVNEHYLNPIMRNQHENIDDVPIIDPSKNHKKGRPKKLK